MFQRRWHIASDDLPVFALLGAAFHGTWAVFLAAALAIEPGSCSNGGSTKPLRGFLAALLGVDAFLTGALAMLLHVGLTGADLTTGATTALC
jgi:hypothetical protein